MGGYLREWTVGADSALFDRLADLGEVYAIPVPLTLYRIRRTSVSSSNLYRQELGSAQLAEEARIGRRFNSQSDFLAWMEQQPSWKARHSNLAAAAMRRQFGRALANGQLLTATRLLRRSNMSGPILRQTLRRVVRGR